VYVFGAVVYALSSLLAWRAGLADRTFSGDAGAENNESDVGAADGASKAAVDDVVKAPGAKNSRTLRRRPPKKCVGVYAIDPIY